MAVEYSLLTWAGLGVTVTFTDAGDIVNLTAHGAPNGHAFQFPNNAGNTLPTGLSKDTTYYLRQGADANKFTIYPTAADAIAGTNQITFTGTGSGTHKVIGAYWATLPATDPGNGGNHKARYGGASGRVYSTIGTFLEFVGTVGNRNVTKDIVLEVQGKWVDTIGGNLPSSAIPGYKSITIWSRIMGVRDSGSFHAGIRGGGYVGTINAEYRNIVYSNNPNTIVDGVELRNTATAGTMAAVSFNSSAVASQAINCILLGPVGLYAQSVIPIIQNNIIYDCLNTGLKVQAASYLGDISHNIVTGCGIGIHFETSTNVASVCEAYGNIAIGNTINWYRLDQSGPSVPSRMIARYNAGDTSDTPTVTYTNGAGTLLTVNLTAHGLPANSPFRVTNSGGALPTGLSASQQYYVKTVVSADTFTLATTINGTAITYTDSGSGTNSINKIYDTDGTSFVMATTDLHDYVNRLTATDQAWYPAASTSPQVEKIPATDLAVTTDIVDAVRPNYESASYPSNTATAGPFEWDHGEGLAPSSVPIAITGMANGSEFAIYKASDMSEIVAPQSTTGSYSGTYTYTGDTNIKVRVRKGSASTKYLPYEYSGTITSTGFALVVAQIPDPIA